MNLNKTFATLAIVSLTTGCMKTKEPAPDTPLISTQLTDSRGKTIFSGYATKVFTYEGEKNTHIFTVDGKHHIAAQGDDLDTLTTDISYAEYKMGLDKR